MGLSPAFSVPFVLKHALVGAALLAEAVVALLGREVHEALVAKVETLVERPGAGVAVAAVVLAAPLRWRRRPTVGS